jgi:hypothetical protein
MRRELTIRCVSAGTIRTESAKDVHCELRDVWLALDGAPAHVRILETCDRGERTRDTTVEFHRIAVRSRSGHELDPPTAAACRPLDWLTAIAGSMVEGDCRTVSLWVRSMDLAALLHAAPASPSGRRTPAQVAGHEQGAAITAPMPQLRLVSAAP